MYLIDSHCHIHDRSCYNHALSRQQIGRKLLKGYPDFPHEPDDFIPEKIIVRAHDAGIKKMICIGTSHEDSLNARDFAEKYHADGVFWSYGIHPDEASELQSPFGKRLATTGASAQASPVTTGRSEARLPKGTLNSLAPALVAIGEVGLDYHNDANRPAQQKLFERMLQLALDYDLPLIFHVREAFDDFFAMLDNFPSARGVVHSFSDNRENLIKSLDHGFYIGVNGLSTFAPELPIADIPLDRILLETDAPFLTPAPFRGTINEPARIREICAHVSKLKGESEADIARITTKNAEQLFHI
ncbi:TatD family hydrolase [Candidatus Saccharibacteria bacterium]|nr:TatD family hydrolase [Candidatus Saccharibacteria bacterium]